MKILAVIGSPHKGKSFEITQKIENKLHEFGDVEFDYLLLKDVNLEPCRGCHVCFFKGEKLCPIKDDREKIEQQLMQADGIIFVSPVYALNITSIMQIFMERFAYIAHRPCYYGKHAMAVVVTGSQGLKGVLKAVSFFENGGIMITDKIGLLTPPTQLPKFMERKNERKINKAAAKFYKYVKTGKSQKPKLGKLIWFRVFRVLGPLKSDSYWEADCKYWSEKGWMDEGTKYYFDTRINVFYKAIAWLSEKIVRMFSGKLVN